MAKTLAYGNGYVKYNIAKEIQAFRLLGFGWAWLDLAQFGPIWISLGFSLDVFPLHICATDLHPELAADGPPTRITADAEPAWLNLDSGLDSSAACFSPR
jgi:hypothetical protein